MCTVNVLVQCLSSDTARIGEISKMNLDDFNRELGSKTEEDDMLDFCRKHVMHGTPYVFNRRDEDFYEFSKKSQINSKFHFMKFI